MGVSESKKQIVIDNYFKNICDVNTSIKEAFTKGFEVGLTKAVFPKSDYEARLKADKEAMLDNIRAEIEFEVDHRTNMLCAEDVFAILDKYKAESEDGMTDKNLCDSCTNTGCMFQSGIVRTKCAFYKPQESEGEA